MNIPNRKNSSVPLLFHIFFLRFLRALRRLFLFPSFEEDVQVKGVKTRGRKRKEVQQKARAKRKGLLRRNASPPLLSFIFAKQSGRCDCGRGWSIAVAIVNVAKCSRPDSTFNASNRGTRRCENYARTLPTL